MKDSQGESGKVSLNPPSGEKTILPQDVAVRHKRKNTDKPAPVPVEHYSREYYLTSFEDEHLFEDRDFRAPERVLGALDLAGELKGKRVLDVGCGRGILACDAAKRGAHVVGIDISEAAVELAHELLSEMDPGDAARVEIRLHDAKSLPFPPDTFDVVFMIDIWEHLHHHEIEKVLREVKRVLRSGGRLIVHTGPNTWFYSYGYPITKFLARVILRRKLPETLRKESDAVMHVNEQSPLSLFMALRDEGYRAKILPRSYLVGINPCRWERLVMKVLFSRPAGYFFCTSLMAVAKPNERSAGQAREPAP